MHPSRRVDLECSKDEAFDRALDGIEHRLGGTVQESDRNRGRIEAVFGLVNSERMTCVVSQRDGKSEILIESRRGAMAAVRAQSDYVESLAAFLTAQQ